MKNHSSQLTGIFCIILTILFLFTLIGCAPSSDDNGNSTTDDTTVNPGFVLSIPDGNTSESGGTATFSIKLNSQPTADVTIAISSNDTGEGTVSPSTLTFTDQNWNANQTVTVTGVDDGLEDGNQSYNVVLAAATSTDTEYDSLKPADVTLYNIDDESVGFTISPMNGTTTEEGGLFIFTIKLNTQPESDVIIPINSDDITEGTVSPSNLTFTPSNWNIAQEVTVTGVSDDIADGNQSYVIVLGAVTTSDTDYQGENPSNVSVTNENANLAPVADAGVDQNVSIGSTVSLDGSGSSDADGDTLTYSWSFTSIPSGSSTTLLGSTTVNPSFTADIRGTYSLSLMVDDGLKNSLTDTVTITAGNILWAVQTSWSSVISPQPISLGNYGNIIDAKEVVGGYHHVLVLSEDGTLSGWGNNQRGELCTSNSTGDIVEISENVIDAAAGYQHTVFLKDDGTVWVCGLNNYGQLGDGTFDNKYIPTQVAVSSISVAASDYSTSFLKQDGTLWQTAVISSPTPGQGSYISQIASGVKIIPPFLGQNPVYISTNDELIDSGTVIDSNVSQVETNSNSRNVYYIKNDDSLFGYGANDKGQLGIGTNVNSSTPVLIANSIVDVGATEESVTFLDTDGNLYGCGSNISGTFNPDMGLYRYVWNPVLITNKVKSTYSIYREMYFIFFLKDI